jgi:hypothetical protein
MARIWGLSGSVALNIVIRAAGVAAPVSLGGPTIDTSLNTHALMPLAWLRRAPTSVRHAHAYGSLAAIALPWVIGMAFSHPTPRVVVPESLMLLVVVVVTLTAGAFPGVLAAANSMLALWVCNLPPGLTLRLSSGYDVMAVIACGVVATVMALTVTWLCAGERAAADRTQAMERARHDDLRLITELQEAILPAAPMNLDGVSFGCAYRAGGGATTAVGGDWYAFIPLDDGRVGVAVGDVVGHGIAAVSVMAEYRFTLRTLAAHGDAPADVLDQLEVLSGRLRRIDAFTTCLYGIIDPRAGSWTYSNAGHLPPLLVRDRNAHVLDAPRRPPIGALRIEPAHVSTTVPLHPGDTLVLYTDGLIERRHEVIDVGIDRLVRRTVGLRESLNDAAKTIVADMVGPDHDDDAALVMVRLDAVITPFARSALPS